MKRQGLIAEAQLASATSGEAPARQISSQPLILASYRARGSRSGSLGRSGCCWPLYFERRRTGDL